MTAEGSRPLNLDQNGTTRIAPEVVEAMVACYRDHGANPASQHGPGRRARRTLEEARTGIAAALGADITGPRGDRLIFTSGGTESNNLAVFGLAGSRPGTVLVSPLEHPSVSGAVGELQRRGYQALRMPVLASGVVDLEGAATLLQRRPRLTCLILGSHETGAVQPVQELARLASVSETFVHTDAVQAVGKIPVLFSQLGVTTLAFTAHKLHGPVGIGGLLVRRETPLYPQLFGGFQQEGLRPGTEPVCLVVGFFRAIQLWFQQVEDRQRHLRLLTGSLESRLMTGDPEAVIHSRNVERLPHTVNVSFPGVDRQALVMALDLAGIAVSTGSACQSGSSELSPTLLAMGLDRSLVNSSIRISLGSDLTLADVESAAARILSVVHDLRQRSNSRKTPGLPRQ